MRACLVTHRMPRSIAITVLLSLAYLLLPGHALASEHIVYVSDDANASAVARSVGASASLEFSEVANGFVADLTAAQAARLAADSRVVDVREDAAFAIAPFRRMPFRRMPFRRMPFRRMPFRRMPFRRMPANEYPFRRMPFRRMDRNSPYFSPFVADAIKRIGADGWANNVDADIAILDGGVDWRHPDLNVVRAVSCVPGSGAMDVDGHGTMVAGIAAAKDNRFGVVGAAPGARIWSVKIADDEGVIMESAALCGLEYVLRNARSIEVANMSWGGEGTPSQESCATLAPQSTQRTRNWRNLRRNHRSTWPWRTTGGNAAEPTIDVLQGVICQLDEQNVTLVAAAGNETADASEFLPAAWDQVITVSSFSDTDGRPGGEGAAGCLTDDPDDTFSSFSNFGAVVDIAAPGECVLSTDTMGNYALGSGTSFAAPLVSGVAAVHASRMDSPTPASIRAKILADQEAGPINGDTDGAWEGILRAKS